MSRLHGSISVTADGFAVTTLGRHLGVVVWDLTTPSSMTVPVGVGPVPLPFAEARLTVDQRRLDRCLIIEVSGSESCDRWRSQWVPELRARWMGGMHGTEPPWQHLRWTFANGNPFAWYRTLVAMCEPRLEGNDLAVPTNGELAARLFASRSVIEKHLGEMHLQLEIEPGRGSREEIVRLAIHHGLVMPGDVDTVLAPFPRPDR